MSKKVLIIDDEQDACQLLQLHLEKKDCVVTCAYTMSDGIEKLVDTEPDLVFLDNRLPDGRGWAMAAKMQKQFPDMKIVLLSGFEMPPYPLSLGLEFARLEKPVKLSEIDAFISQPATGQDQK
jgi:two-component system sensor histidine kinase/response regulator